ncbi:MAG: RsbRD N-terminal domain-containing protein [Candidatus Korobacteraceae bacterium]|jgi:hypothetical protein
MNTDREILEKWIGRLADSQPEQFASLRAPDPDPFRNPVGYAVRESLSQIWQQLLTEMDQNVIDAALDTVLRIRAVQEVSPGQAVGFVFQLRPLIRDLSTTLDLAVLESRIDQLILVAFDKYTQCREEIIAVRFHEAERLRPRRHQLDRKGCP